MQELTSVALITILAVVSPGADFALVTRNSFLYGRKMGLLTALGIGAGVQIHVLYAMAGIGLIMATQPILLTALKTIGASYLIHMGHQIFLSPPVTSAGETHRAPSITALQAFKMGVFTNALNPKTTLFVLSTYSQIVQPSTPLWRQCAYGLFMSIAHWLWFALIALFFSSPHLRDHMLRHQHRINRIIGLILMLLGIALAWSSFS